MPLLRGNLLLQRLVELAGKAKQIDIAVAWARPCDAVETLVASGADKRIVVGLSNHFTDPITLRRLQKSATLRVVPDASPGIFHPKYYRFRGEGTICWVGSANLTGGGFGGNDELVHEFEDDTEDDGSWFEMLWNRLEPNSELIIADYEARYTPPTPPPRRPHHDGEPDLMPIVGGGSWREFVDGLQSRDAYCHYHEYGWDVLGAAHSYLHTILTGREVVRLAAARWKNLSNRECYILRGYNTEDGGWGLLGTLKGAGKVARAFNPERMPDVGPVRMQVRQQIQRVLDAADNEIADVAHSAVQEIRAIDGFGAAAATRLLTLARPDRLVSVNSESADGLGALSELPQTRDSLADNYGGLLQWIYEQPWFNEHQPHDSLERVIWNCRVALLDAFVYEEING